MFKAGDKVKHPVRGEGVIRFISPLGRLATVRYPSREIVGGAYVRTHRVVDLRKVGE